MEVRGDGSARRGGLRGMHRERLATRCPTDADRAWQTRAIGLDLTDGHAGNNAIRQGTIRDDASRPGPAPAG